jgi:alpha-tubulin suppressor-like RCC1 family protein
VPGAKVRFILPVCCLAAMCATGVVGASTARAALASRPAVDSATAPTSGSGSSVHSWGIPEGHIKPTLVSGIPDPVTEIATSDSDTYALDSTGAVWAWGLGKDGELGDGAKTNSVTTPVKVQFPAGVSIVSLPNPMPFDTALAIDSEGDAWGWGDNNQNELCSTKRKLLLPVMLPLTDVTLASGAGGHVLFLSGGAVSACGTNTDGELGDGTTSNSPGPKAVVGLPDEPVQALVSSWQGSGAVMADGSYYDWGYNGAGQMGDGNTMNSAEPVQVPLPAAVTEVSQGGSSKTNGQTVALLSDGSVWSWGNGESGQLGDGGLGNASSPVQVAVPPGVTFTQINSGGASSYALDSKGHLWAWGDNNVGQLGTDGKTTELAPVSVGITLTQVSSTAENAAGLDAASPTVTTGGTVN